MKRIVSILLTTMILLSAQAQQFRLVEDTVRINASDFISPVSKFEMKWSAQYHGYLFCIFDEQPIYEGWRSQKHLLVISADGKDITEVDLPDDFRGATYGDFFVRNDSLLLKCYHEQSGWCLDVNTWQWQPVKAVSDIIYEDDQYSIAYIDIGEWGDYTWFIEKNTRYDGIPHGSPYADVGEWRGYTSYIDKPSHPKIKDHVGQYVMCGDLQRIIKKDEVYYFIRGSKVDTLLSLKGKAHPCVEGSTTYEFAAQRHFGFTDNIHNMGGLKTTPLPTLFRFTGREDTDNWWGGKTYDTLFVDAFMTHGDIFYLTNTGERTFIGQLVEGKLQEKLDLGQHFVFFRNYDCYRGENPAPDQCFLQFEENKNSFGVLAINDTLIHIRHIVHNQDSLPHIGTDNIEPLLDYLLQNLNHITVHQIDSLEESLSATGIGTIQPLVTVAYPHYTITPDEYGAYSYYTTIDSKSTLSVNYYVRKNDSVVRGALFEWIPTNLYNSSELIVGGKIKNWEEKKEEIRHILTRLTGTEPTEITDRGHCLQWKYRGITVRLDNWDVMMYLDKE